MEIMKANDKHCGPVCIARKLGIDVEAVMQQWPSKWSDKQKDTNWLGLPIDTHWHHKAYFKEKGYGMTMLDKPEVGAIVLLNKTMWQRHWCIVKSVGNLVVMVDWLNGKEIAFNKIEFDQLFSTWPCFMYKIGGEPVELSLFERLILKVL